MEGNYSDALYKFGQALHTAQDEAAHNWCTLDEHNAMDMDLLVSNEKKK